MSKHFPLHYLFYVTMNIYFFIVNTARDVVMVLLIFLHTHLSLYQHIFTRTYRGTHTQAHMYDQHTKGKGDNQAQKPVGRDSRKAFVRDKGLAHKKKLSGNPDISNKKKLSTYSFQQSY